MSGSGITVTFADLERRANQWAHFFRDRGLVERDTLAIVMENNEHVLPLMWAARRSGLYYTPVNVHLTAAETAHIIADSGAAAIISSARCAQLCTELPTHGGAARPETRVVVGDFPDPALAGWLRYSECVAHAPASPLADEIEGDLLQYSSGTTGRPKGIRRALAHQSPDQSASPIAGLLDSIGMSAGSVYLSPAPLYHTAPAMWTMSAQALGATVVVMEKFDARATLAAIERYRVTHGQFVPTMFVRMLKLAENDRTRYDISSLQRVVHAAAPCPVDVKHQMIRWWGHIIDEYYSSSEGAGVTYISAAEWLTHPGSVGRPVVGTAHILGTDGEELAVGEPGDIYFEGGFPFDYLNDPAKTASSHNQQGWVSVGDMGYLDEDGYLYLTDRRHHMIISGGVNIYPREVEDLLITHPKVLDAAVIGIPDADMGQQVRAYVQTVAIDDATADFAEELLRWTRQHLAHYKCPRSVAFGELPRSETGKMLKHKILQ